MQVLKQSTTATILVGPVLDADGAAYTSAVIGDFNLTKNGSTAALAAAATATHSHNGMYLIALTTGNTDTLGRLDVSMNNTSYGMTNHRYEVLTANQFDALVTNGSVTPAAIADAVWDEPYNQHTSAGSFGKLMDLLRKANLTIDGEVTNAITPTTLTFSSNVSAVTSAYAHAVLLFVSGPLEGENSPIVSYNSTNGVFVLEEPLTAAPSNGDEFVVIAGSHVHAIADIQAGLALQTTSLAIKAKTDLITTDTVFVTVDRVAGSTITMAYNESTTATVPLDEDTTSLTLRFVVENSDQLDVLVIENASITRTASNCTVTITTAVTATLGQYRWALRDITGGINRLIEGGVLQVISAANKDA